MSKILYRMKPSAEIAFKLASEGYEVKQATRTMDFESMEDKYKAAIYRKLPEVSSLLEVEQLFAEYWADKHPGVLIEMINIPQHLKMFSLPAGVGLVTEPIDLVLGNQKQIKEGVEQRDYIISTLNKPLVEVNKVPQNILEEFAEVAKLDLDIDLLPLFYAQYHFQLTGELFYKSNLLWIISQVLFERQGIKGVKVPTGKSSYITVIPKGCWGPLEDINSYIKYSITKELDAPKVEWTTASNQIQTEGLTVLPVQAKISNVYSEKDFVKYLFDKLRPDEQGAGTIPFDIPVSSLVQAYLFEVHESVSSKSLPIPERKDLVTKLNAYHAMRYNVFLKGRKNTTETQLLYFGTLKHPASSDAAIKRGQAYLTNSNASKLNNEDVIF